MTELGVDTVQATRRRKSGPRWLLRVVLCLTLGVVGVVATAWAPGIWRGVRAARFGPSAGEDWSDKAKLTWLIDGERRLVGQWKHTFTTDRYAVDSGPIEGMATLPANWPDTAAMADAPVWAVRPPKRFNDGFAPPKGIDASTMAFGWPWRSMRSVTLNGGRDGYFGYEMHGLWEFKLTKLARVRLPLDPIWPGFLGGAVMWAGVAAVPLVVAPMLRRVLRRQAGRCAACGYVLTGLVEQTGCPECGERGLINESEQ